MHGGKDLWKKCVLNLELKTISYPPSVLEWTGMITINRFVIYYHCCCNCSCGSCFLYHHHHHHHHILLLLRVLAFLVLKFSGTFYVGFVWM